MRGEAGRAWLDQLPATIDRYARRWLLTVQPAFANLSYNYVAPATRADGSPAVLKIGLATDAEFGSEIEALRVFDGHGMVRLLEADPKQAVMLLDRVQPGRPLTTVADDAEATLIAATLMRDFWPPAPTGHAFPSVVDWGRGFQRLRTRFDGGSGPIPEQLATKAERLFGELAGSAAAPVLLHGDLHHDNILAGPEGRWTVIDPKGVTGEPAYELGAFLRNPGSLMSNPDPRRVTERRIAIFSEVLGLDPERIRRWAMAQSVLSAWWAIEDNSDWLDLALAFAELFDDLLAPRS
jgi:streptomycin 6-kinase